MRTRYILASGSSVTLHVLVGVGILWLASAPPRTHSENRRGNAMAAFIVAPPEDSRFPGLNPTDTTLEDWPFRRGDEPSARSIGGFTFDVAKIAGRAQVLFPFLTPGLSLEHFALTPQGDIHESLRDPFALARAGQQSRAANRALVLGDAALQTLIDKAWSRRDRWSTFQPIIKLAETYSPDVGKLPNVLQTYKEQNWLQPYSDTTIRDPRLWTELGLAADHVSFVGFISRYASGHPSTKATTELLFLLDKVVQASRDTLATLLDTDPTEQLAWTRNANRNAYNLIAEIRRYYVAELERRGLTSADGITACYDKVRLAILTGILRSTPHDYRANDARFLIGAIYWRERKARDALHSWRDITVDPTDSYVAAYSDLLRAMRAVDTQPSVDDKQIDQALRTQINRTLDAERGRWLTFSFDRLRQFGYRFDTF